MVDLIYVMSEGIPYYMQVLACNCFANAVDDEVGINELKQSFSRSLFKPYQENGTINGW